MTSAQFSQLPHAIARWLSFQRLCGRQMMFSESYLAQPIAEFISYHHAGRLAPEHNHPIYSTKLRGRQRQVDFALLTRDKLDVQHVIEAKWVRDRNYDTQKIVDDLLRLECFRDRPGRHVSRYFLIAGMTDDVVNHFESLRFRSGGTNKPFTRRFLSTDIMSPRVDIDVYGRTGSIREFFRKYQVDYKRDVPKTFFTELMAAASMDDVLAYLWQVSSVPGRSVFAAKAPW